MECLLRTTFAPAIGTPWTSTTVPPIGIARHPLQRLLEERRL
jgi:hypothetical protein